MSRRANWPLPACSTSCRRITYRSACCTRSSSCIARSASPSPTRLPRSPPARHAPSGSMIAVRLRSENGQMSSAWRSPTMACRSRARHGGPAGVSCEGVFLKEPVMQSLEQVLDRLRRGSSAEYGSDRVSQLEHALQCATQAEEAGATPALIIAALLHDIGHLVHDLGRDVARRGIDDRHEVRGRDWLCKWFAEDVTGPVRLHVDAKRYLCAVDPAYFATLSPGSVRSLALQGGPFPLAEGRGVDELSAAIEAFAAQHHSVLAPPLTLASLSGFWALVSSRPCGTVDRLAEDCVRWFDAFRAPPSIDELTRRRRAGLSEAQDALLVRWGYPYVMEAFRFHLTLTQRLDPAEGARLACEVSSMVAPLCREARHIDAIGLFHQPTPQANFRLVRRYRLAGAISSSGGDR